MKICGSVARCGALNNNWKGGRTIASNGYVLVRVGVGHHLADVRGYAYEHRLVAEAALGRPLRDDEEVHHRDEDKTNNDPANLDVLTRAEHRFEHRDREVGLRLPHEGNPTVDCACGCGATFPRYDDCGRPRNYLPGHNPSAAPVTDAILRSLAGGSKHRAAIAADVGGDPGAVAVALSRLKRAGVVVNCRRGVWRRAG